MATSVIKNLSPADNVARTWKYTDSEKGFTARFTRYGNLVHATYGGSLVLSAGWNIIIPAGTMPEYMRPANGFGYDTKVSQDDTSKRVLVSIYADGQFRLCVMGGWRLPANGSTVRRCTPLSSAHNRRMEVA